MPRPWINRQVMSVMLRAGRVVAGAAVLGIGMAACGGPTVSTPAAAVSGKLRTDYRPSQPTGWEMPLVAQTIGGHFPSVDLTYRHKPYRIALLSFGQPGNSPNPAYEAVPRDPQVAFKRTLGRESDRDYTFRYLHGLPEGAWFTVESYGVLAYPTGEGIGYRADVYIVYHPGHTTRKLAINSELQFIQVIYSANNGTRPPTFVDSMSPPFYGKGGGLTSIDRKQIVNFYDEIRLSTGSAAAPSATFKAETFLVQDTGKKNAAGKDIVNIYGGIEWGLEIGRTG
jgi:hypothetical protein